MVIQRWILGGLAGALLSGCAPDAAPTPPVGKQLLVGGALTLRGMTSDGWIVYSDDQTLTLHAVALSGGTPQDIVTLGNSFAISVWGKTVFAWSNKNDAAVGALTVWTSDGGPHAASSSSLAPWVAATMDGSHVLYLDHVDATGNGGDLVMADAGGSSPRVILGALTGLSNDGCHALLGFAGSHAIAAHCEGGASSPTISSFDLTTFARADLATGAATPWSTDPAGTILLTATSAGTIVVPLGGGAATVLDPAGSSGVLIADGSSAIYGASSGALKRSPVSAPSPTTLVGSGVGGLYGVSPGGEVVLYYRQMDPVSLISDLYLASATDPGTPATLSGTQSAAVFGDAFTADGSHALYSTNVDTTWQTITINALAPGEQAPTVLTQTGWVVWATTGSKVVFSDHYTWTGARGHADIRSADVAKGGDAALVVNQANSEIFLSPARDQVAYTWSLEDSPRAGLYVAGIP